MRCGLVARKLGMSRLFNENGRSCSSYCAKIEDLEVLSIKSVDKDGYNAVCS